MDMCLFKGEDDAFGCIHPLPCPLHGTHVEPVTVVLSDYEWLVARAPSGDEILTLRLKGSPGQWYGTRMYSVDEDAARVREFMLRERGIMPTGTRVRAA